MARPGHARIEARKPEPARPATRQPEDHLWALQVRDVGKIYPSPSGPVRALNSVSFDLRPDRVTGLVGANGSGKTTLVKACCGLVTCSGSIRYASPARNRARSKPFAAMLEGNRNLYWKLTVRENIAFFAGLRGISDSAVEPRARVLLDALGLFERRGDRVESLSRGMQQKAALICALITGAPVLFLDEPTLGLDVDATRHLVEFLRDSDLLDGRAVLVATHDLHFLEQIAHDLIVIEKGRILSQGPLDHFGNRLAMAMVSFACPEDEEGRAGPLERALPLRVFRETRAPGRTSHLVPWERSAGLSDLALAYERAGVKVLSVSRIEHSLEELYAAVRAGETVKGDAMDTGGASGGSAPTRAPEGGGA